ETARAPAPPVASSRIASRLVTSDTVHLPLWYAPSHAALDRRNCRGRSAAGSETDFAVPGALPVVRTRLVAVMEWVPAPRRPAWAASGEEVRSQGDVSLRNHENNWTLVQYVEGRRSRNDYGAKDAACRATKSRTLVAGLPRIASTSWVRRS